MVCYALIKACLNMNRRCMHSRVHRMQKVTGMVSEKKQGMPGMHGARISQSEYAFVNLNTSLIAALVQQRLV